ncbi:MAG TPA: ATP-grasp domain-containing protein [Gaiellaceae bacterium]|nr:ATP-grasp domain-containing protein [Gaiellaceae bacterium]
MRFAVVAHARSETNMALAAAAVSLGAEGEILAPRDALRALGPRDVALGRLDVREGLDGIETGGNELERLARSGVDVLNPPNALAAAHDKLLTARVLRLNGLPHPHSWLVADGMPSVAPDLPVVLKPRFGSWGRDVVLCRTKAELDRELERLRYRDWFREHGALAQELVPPLGWDLRVIVAGGRVIGAARRFAASGEWRTNVALGGRTVPVAPPPLARRLALAAAAAIGADLVGVDLLPTASGYVIAELNGAVDFRAAYALDGSDVFELAVLELLRAAADRRALAAVGA